MVSGTWDLVQQPWLQTEIVSDALDLVGCQGVLDGLNSTALAGPRVVGRAVTATIVESDVGGIPGLAEFLDRIRPGVFIVLGWQTDRVASSMGGNAALRARLRGAVGAVIDGWARDIDEIEETGLPVWSRGLTPRSGSGRLGLVGDGSPTSISDVIIREGDLVVADRTGVCIVPQDYESQLLPVAQEVGVRDSERTREVMAGEWPAI